MPNACIHRGTIRERAPSVPPALRRKRYSCVSRLLELGEPGEPAGGAEQSLEQLRCAHLAPAAARTQALLPA
eukprot:6190137-Pleurochrysis_carterae.AAC.1